MSHKLDDITLYYYPKDDTAKRFAMKQNVVSDLYVNYLNGYKPPKTSRISVTLSNEDRIEFYFGSILTVNAFFDKDPLLARMLHPCPEMSSNLVALTKSIFIY